jgi:signal transduction histidine kinase
VIASGERMTRLIDQLLDVTRARIGGGILVHRSLTDLHMLARQTIDELALAHRGSRVELHATGNVRGSWDPDRLAQVFSNLLSNALQHGTGEPVAITIAGGAAMIRIVFQNHGMIPAELVATVFEPFRGSRQKRDGSAGMGLGLYITQQIVEAHGGTIEVVSQDGRTTFAIDLPRV